MRKDDRWCVELPSGFIKNPVFPVASCDFDVNDCVYLKEDMVYPMFSDEFQMYGVVAAKGIKGKPVLVATAPK